MRFTKALVDGLVSADEAAEVTFFADAEAIAVEGLEAAYAGTRVTVVPIQDETVTTSARGTGPIKAEEQKSAIWRTGRDLLKRNPALHRFAQNTFSRAKAILLGEKPFFLFEMPAAIRTQLDEHDIIYLAFPFYMKAFDAQKPVVATFHDLNHLHFPENFSIGAVEIYDRDVREWSEKVTLAVTSTHVIESELTENYDAARGKTRVAYVAPYSVRSFSAAEREAALEELGLGDRDFVVYPANTHSHKNLLRFVQAAERLKALMGAAAPVFVVTGFQTDLIGKGDEPGYARTVADWIRTESSLSIGEDVRFLGYVSDVQVDALTHSAKLVVSTSIYEAGCGPALDAWQFGVPVAFSDIPPFAEQIEALHTEAWTFDPADPDDIAATLKEALDRYEESLAMAVRSKQAISAYGWCEAASCYLDIFREAIAMHDKEAGV